MINGRVKEVAEPSQPVPHNDRYRVFDWGNGDVSFSAAWKGKGMSCHVAASRDGKKVLRGAVNDFCNAMFESYKPECLFAITDIKSVINLTLKCGFKRFAMTDVVENGKIKKATVMVRFKDE